MQWSADAAWCSQLPWTPRAISARVLLLFDRLTLQFAPFRVASIERVVRSLSGLWPAHQATCGLCDLARRVALSVPSRMPLELSISERESLVFHLLSSTWDLARNMRYFAVAIIIVFQ